MATKQEIFREHLGVWLAARGDRKRRGEIIKQVSAIAKIHPKSVGRAFRRVQLSSASRETLRGRSVYYTKDVDAALYDLWEAANRPCGELLYPLIGEYLEVLLRDSLWQHGEEATGKLRTMSEMTVRRRVGTFRIRYGVGRGRSATRASDLKRIVPIFKGPWESLPPGNGQLDTVAHCGDSLLGDFAYTVNYTDAATYWGSRRAQWNKGQEATKGSLVVIKQRLPFLWLMGHPDTGSEFINYLTLEWCDAEGIRLTRSEPGRKNDNMYVEERNGHVVRKYLGWQRLDADPGIVVLMNDYYDMLDLYLNHFQAVRRTLVKERVGSKYVRVFEKVAKTPYQRVLGHPAVSAEVKEKLRREHDALNPLLLKRRLDTLKKKIFDYQKKRGRGKTEEKLR
jgi:hypothetical protein